MKRFFALMLVVCMLLCAAAMAENKVVLQDEMPPMAIAAKICDVSGNVLAEVENDGSLQLTDVHFRGLVNDAVISARLTGAYEGVMADVHFGDVACKLHDHAVKFDINEAVAPEMIAYDLVMYELFDVTLNGEAAAALAQAEGNYMEVTFELKEDQWLPLVVLYTMDGQAWQIINHEQAAANAFTVKLPANGSLALLIDGAGAMEIGEKAVYTYEEDTPATGSIPSEGNTGNFTPSVYGKEEPYVVVIPGTDGENLVGYIYDERTASDIPVPDRNYIVITAVSERDYVADVQTHEHLEWAYDSILQAENVGQLLAANGTALAAELDASLANQGIGLIHNQLVVKDLFEVTAYGDYVEYLYNPANYLEITFDANLGASQLVAVLYSADSVHWNVMPAENYSVAANGNVTLKMHDLGAVAFLVEAEQIVNAAEAVQSPD